MPVDTATGRARALIGTPFRLHGRSAETGLDCVGLVALAYGEAQVPTGYAMRNSQQGKWTAILDTLAEEQSGAPQPGDILMMQAGPAQLHLGIWTGDSLIHADASLRRVIETAGPVAWPILGAWRRIHQRT